MAAASALRGASRGLLAPRGRGPPSVRSVGHLSLSYSGHVHVQGPAETARRRGGRVPPGPAGSARPRVGSERTHPGCPWHLRHGGKRHVASPLSSRGHVGNGWRWKLCAFFVNLPGGRGPVCPSRCLRPGDAPLGRQGPSTLVAPGSGSFYFLRRRKVYDVPVFVSIPEKLRAPQPEVPVIIFPYLPSLNTVPCHFIFVVLLTMFLQP